MAKRLSTGAVDFISQEGGVTQALANGRIFFFAGTQPATADEASGTSIANSLVEFTKASGAFTAETRATAIIDLTGITTAETITSITVGGFEILGATVTYATSAANTAYLLATQINAFKSYPDIKAVYTTGNTLTLVAPKNSGVSFNNQTIIAAGTGVWNGAASHFTSNGVAATATPNTWSSGNGRFGTGAGGSTAGVEAVNGLNFTFPNASPGVAVKETAAWTGVAKQTGTAGWFRFCGDGTDPNTASATAIRFDGSIGTSGTDLIVSSTSITQGATQTVNTFTINTLPNQ